MQASRQAVLSAVAAARAQGFGQGSAFPGGRQGLRCALCLAALRIEGQDRCQLRRCCLLIQAPLRVLNSIEGLLRGLARGVQLPRATPGQRPECLAQSPDGKGAEAASSSARAVPSFTCSVSSRRAWVSALAASLASLRAFCSWSKMASQWPRRWSRGPGRSSAA